MLGKELEKTKEEISITGCPWRGVVGERTLHGGTEVCCCGWVAVRLLW